MNRPGCRCRRSRRSAAPAARGCACRTSSAGDPDGAPGPRPSSACSRAVRAAHRAPGTRGRAPPASRASPSRCSSARSGAPRPAAAPGSCRAGASDPRRRQATRSSPTSCAPLRAGTRGRPRRARAAAPATGWLSTKAKTGAAAHRARNGAARISASGRTWTIRAASPKAASGTRRHRREERAQAALQQPRGPRRLRGGRLPVQQTALGDDQPHQRQRDRVQHLPGVVGQEHQRQERLSGRRAQILDHAAHVDPGRLAHGRTRQQVEHGRDQREGDDGQRARGSTPAVGPAGTSRRRRTAPSARARPRCDAGCRGSSTC